MLSYLPARLQKLSKFIISGGSSAAINLGILYFCTEYLHLWYILSAIIAFCIAFIVSFTLQKWWTFSDASTDIVHRQLAIYLTLAVINLMTGTLILFTFVEFFGVHYLLAQIMAQGLIACVSFFVYQHVLFAAEHKRPYFIRAPKEFVRAAFPPLRVSLFLSGATLFLVAIPFLYTITAIGLRPLHISLGAYAESGYYIDRIHEIKDGHPLMGNPYFLEYAGSLPPAFFVADWVASVPYLLGLPLQGLVLFDFLLWSLIFVLLLYAILQRLLPGPWHAGFGSLAIYLVTYAYMMPMVSMQVVYPSFALFLLSFLLWLEEPDKLSRRIALSITAALAAYVYTYSMQIIVVALGLVGLYLLFLRDFTALKKYFMMGSLFVVLSLPLAIFTLIQITDPLYFETMARIGLVHTRLPIAHALFVLAAPALMLVLSLTLFPRREWPRFRECSATALFFGSTGLALVIVSLSNVITGTDLELPQHIERFVVVWFGLSFAYLISVEGRRIQKAAASFPKNALVIPLLLCATYVAGNYFSTFGARSALSPLKGEAVQHIQLLESYAAPLTWLRENVDEPSVIWTDPASRLNIYIPRFTPHYVLFSESASLQLVSDRELEERYLVANYFSLTKKDLEDQYIQYAGTGNAVHAYKTHNRKVRVCHVLQLPRYGVDCGEMTDMVHFKGEKYFSDLFARYENEIRPNIQRELEKYSVSYIVADKETDSPAFHPEKLPFMKIIYSDGRFTIYHMEQ